MLACSVVFNSVTPWIVAHQALCPRDFPGENTWMDSHFLLQMIFLTQGSNPCLLHVSRIAGTFFTTIVVQNVPAMCETWVQSLGWEDLLEKRKATHSSILAWRIPRTRKESDMTEQLSLHFTSLPPSEKPYIYIYIYVYV